MIWVILFFCALALVVVLLVRASRRAGPRQLSAAQLNECRVLLNVSSGASDRSVWSKLGTLTASRGLDLKFDHDDDPQAEATLLVPGADESPRKTLANRLTVQLGSEFQSFHVHTGGFVFRVCMRGAGQMVGRETIIKMIIDSNGAAYGGRIENDDDTRAAVGDWIQIRRLEILEVPRLTA